MPVEQGTGLTEKEGFIEAPCFSLFPDDSDSMVVIVTICACEFGLQIKLMLDGSNTGASRAVGPGNNAQHNILDDALSASAVLLRDIHSALLRIVEGKGCVAGEPPRCAKLSEDDKNAEHWTQRVSLCLLRAPLDEVDEETRVML